MRFDGFVSRYSLLAGGLAVACLALALLASSVVAAHRLDAALCQPPAAYGETVMQG